MADAYSFVQGHLPILISMPHAGVGLTPEVERGLVEDAQPLPDTDWHIPRLYDFVAELGISRLSANYSRYVVDLNRSADDKPLYAGATTGLFPSTLFDGSPLFKPGLEPTAAQRATYLAEIWTPYHERVKQELARMKAQHGVAILFDAHSICSVVPHLFDGVLPDFNFGTNSGKSCSAELQARVASCIDPAGPYSSVVNGRFKGGYITREYGQPEQNIHAIQLELAQKNYMDEFAPFNYREDLAQACRQELSRIISALLAWVKAEG